MSSSRLVTAGLEHGVRSLGQGVNFFFALFLLDAAATVRSFAACCLFDCNVMYGF